MAGYDGYSKSNNAVDAEADGRYPLTKAARIVARETGVTIKEARRILQELGTGEWHHSSKFYNAVNYYDTTAAVKTIELSRRLNMTCDASFIATIKACDLQNEGDPLATLQHPDDKYSYTVERFRQAVETGEWL